LTEIGVATSSFVDLTELATLTDYSVFPQSGIGFVKDLDSSGIYLETDICDFNLLGQKTVMRLEVSGSYGPEARMYMSVKWRMNRSAPWRQSPWKRCTADGACSPIVSGSEFKFCIAVTPVKGTSLDGLTAEWKLTDKRGIRGTYAGGASPDTSG
jgi:hypothetical protein